MNPDGDALGSTIGLIGYILQQNRDFRLFLPTPISASLLFMVPEQIKDRIVVWDGEKSEQITELVNSCDLVIGSDFNVPSRIGDFGPLLTASTAYKILVDHHVAPAVEHFNLVFSRTDTSSASELMYYLLKEMPGIGGDASKMSVITREALMTGMTTDTNNFSNSTYPSTLTMASELIAAGTDRDKIIGSLFFNYPLRRIKAQGYILDRLMKITDEGVAYMILDTRVQNRFGLKEGDTEGFVNIPLSIASVRMSILLKKEKDSKKIRVSLRSKKGTSARNMAMKYFNGGGHELASGGKLIIGEDIDRMSNLEKYVKNCIHEFFMEQ